LPQIQQRELLLQMGMVLTLWAVDIAVGVWRMQNPKFQWQMCVCVCACDILFLLFALLYFQCRFFYCSLSLYASSIALGLHSIQCFAGVITIAIQSLDRICVAD
jgi:hypothetical protein